MPQDTGSPALLHSPLRPSLTLLAGLVVFVVGLALTVYASHLDQKQRISERRAEVQAELSDFRARLETEIYTGIALARGLGAQLVILEGMSSPEFAAVSAQLLRNNRYITSLSLAPGFVVNDVYPLAGNELELGVDLLADPVQKQAVLRAIQRDDAVLAGPFDTRRGPALAGRIPLWVNRDGVPRLWGVVSVTLDYRRLLREAGIERLEKELLINLRGLDAAGPGGEIFRGEAIAKDADAVKVPVFLPGGSWLLSAAPPQGWHQRPWWRTPTGSIGLIMSLLTGLAILRIAQDRQRIRLLAGSDALTSLPNRRWAMSHLSRLMARSERSGETFALLSFDLNGFKPVNDTYGHAAGDLLLAEIARRLRDSMRPDDLVARMGGDEFLALVRVEPNAGQEWLQLMANRVQAVVQQPVLIDGHSVRVGTSIGIACYPQDGQDAATLLRRADEAMYQAKRERSSGLAFAQDLPPDGLSPEGAG